MPIALSGMEELYLSLLLRAGSSYIGHHSNPWNTYYRDADFGTCLASPGGFIWKLVAN
jgi:hypothetical protein